MLAAAKLLAAALLDRLVRATPRPIQRGGTLVARTVRDSIEDRVLGLSAEVAYFMIFALPPTLLALLAAAGFIGDALGPDVTERITHRIVDGSRAFLTRATVEEIVAPTVARLLTRGRADVASFGVIFALWSASRATSVLVEAITIAYDVEDTRPMWRRRLLALWLTLAGILVTALTLPLLVAGPRLGDTLARSLGLADAFELIYALLYWPVVGVLGVAALTTLYHVAPPFRTPWRRDVPGALLALALWIAGSAGLRAYAGWAFGSQSVYGSLAAPMVILLWLHFTALSVLMGAELNAEIEKMWPSGSPTGAGAPKLGPSPEGEPS